MQRFTISLDDRLAAEFDRLIAEHGYDNRSEAVRDLLRSRLDRAQEAAQPDAACVACLSYVYNHHELDLAARLMDLQHDHHELTVSSMHAHLDHEHCIETLILRGPAQAVRRFADRVTAERGVHHGELNLVVAEVGDEHRHAGGGHRHVHLPPRR
jgi:CopG family transcriptional regulator, nickel-responsive regulator